MSERTNSIERVTRETDIRLTLSVPENRPSRDSYAISTGLPFFDHMLLAFGFHGGFGLQLEARGDIEVDPHHLVEDVGIVLGDALHALKREGMARYGQAAIPMDDALSEVIVDVSGRAYLMYDAKYPQEYAGSFQLALLKEFFQALASRAQVNLHLLSRYGQNGHHMAESLFKALGRALSTAYALDGEVVMSTKGSL